MSEECEKVEGVEISSNLASTRQAIGNSHDEITGVVHVPAPPPETRNKKLSCNGFRFFSPNRQLWVSLELVLLGIAGSEDVITQQIQQNHRQRHYRGFVIRVSQQIVALNREGKGDKDIVSKDQHIPELLTDYVPCGEHLFLIPKIVQHVDSC